MPVTNRPVPESHTDPVPGNPLLQGMAAASTMLDLRALGSSGLKEFGGFIYESTLDELQGKRAVTSYKEMGDNDATAATILYAVDKLLRKVPSRVVPASTAQFDVDAADFLETCMHDMDEPWTDFTAEAMVGMMQYGFALNEKVYKRRAGDSPELHLNSRYADGRIGWRALASRSQDSIYKWVFDDNGRLVGVEQQAPPRNRVVYLPMDKCLLFRTSTEKGDPQGKSIFRGSWRSYYLKRGLENIEGVGAERDVCGIPIAWLPQEVLAMAEAGDKDAKALVVTYKNIAQNLRRDAQEGIVMPLAYDANGNKMFDLTLLSSGGSRQFDLDKIIRRYDSAIARNTLADFLFLGDAGAAGSWAMHNDKTALFLHALSTFLDIFSETLNKHAVQPLMKLNGFHMSEAPRIEFGSLDKVNPSEIADTILKLTQAGMPMFPDKELEKFLRESAGLPEAVEDLGEVSDIVPQRHPPAGKTEEMVDDAPVLPQAALEHQALMQSGPDKQGKMPIVKA
ncbi:MAG: hypothetical protein EOO38_01485 [Cytophagaceae bacterium]|nr:MAG: hypothetical protein EOO38_01485 [Cytophagaceae bacterium]